MSNRPDLLEGWLLPSLAAQTVPWELRVVDAAAEGHSSCASALNAGAADTSPAVPWLLFVHQDVAFEDRSLLERALELMQELPDVGIAGPVGATERPLAGRERRLNRLWSGEPRQLVELSPIPRPTRAQTLDELMVFIPRARFERQRFDADACPDWHLYAVEYCLSVLRVGAGVYVLPLTVHHRSGGRLDAGYYRTLRRVVAKHRDRFGRISTTSEVWPTLLPGALQRPWHYGKVVARILRERVHRQR